MYLTYRSFQSLTGDRTPTANGRTKRDVYLEGTYCFGKRSLSHYQRMGRWGVTVTSPTSEDGFTPPSQRTRKYELKTVTGTDTGRSIKDRSKRSGGLLNCYRRKTFKSKLKLVCMYTCIKSQFIKILRRKLSGVRVLVKCEVGVKNLRVSESYIKRKYYYYYK